MTREEAANVMLRLSQDARVPFVFRLEVREAARMAGIALTLNGAVSEFLDLHQAKKVYEKDLVIVGREWFEILLDVVSDEMNIQERG